MKNSPLCSKTKLDKLDWWTYLGKNRFFGRRFALAGFDGQHRFRRINPSRFRLRRTRGICRIESEKRDGLQNDRRQFAARPKNLQNESARKILKPNTLVTEINQRKTESSPSKPQLISYKADACICTAPTNSLLKIKFNPPLPSAQTEAAEKLIYARICKNSVLYENRFWKDENFSMVSDVTSHFYFHSTQNQAGKEGILTSYAIGEKADILASQSDERRMKIITDDLTDFDKDAPKLAKGIASYAWQRDKYTDGAYALYRPGQWFGIRPILQRPHLKVLFAGEHLADWQGFMEGAIETGEAAAQSLIR